METFDYLPVLARDGSIISIRRRRKSSKITKQTRAMDHRRRKIRNLARCSDRDSMSSISVVSTRTISDCRNADTDMPFRPAYDNSSLLDLVDECVMGFSMIYEPPLLNLRPALSTKLIKTCRQGCRKNFGQCITCSAAQRKASDLATVDNLSPRFSRPPNFLLLKRLHDSALSAGRTKAPTDLPNYEKSERNSKIFALQASSSIENPAKDICRYPVKLAAAAAAQQQLASEMVSSESTKSLATSGVSVGAQTINRKRSHQDEGNDGSGDDGKDPKRSKKGTLISEDDGEEICFACPFRKHNPRKYHVGEWRHCALTGHKTVARVKAHLYKYHLIFPCPRCKVLFNSEALLDKHMVSSTRCDVADSEPLDGISPRLQAELKSRKKAFKGQTEANRWQQVYNIIFPNEVAPDPYFEPIRDTDQDTGNVSLEAKSLEPLEDHLREEVPKLFRLALENTISNGMESIDYKLRSHITDLVRQATDQAFESYKTKSTSHAAGKVTESKDSGYYEPSVVPMYQNVPPSNPETSSELVVLNKPYFDLPTEDSDTEYPSWLFSEPSSSIILPSISSYTEQAEALTHCGSHFPQSANRLSGAPTVHWGDPYVLPHPRMSASTTKHDGTSIYNPSNQLDRYTGRSSTDLSITSLISPQPKDRSDVSASSSAFAAWKRLLQVLNIPKTRHTVRCGDLDVPDLAFWRLSRWMKAFAERKQRG